MYLRSSPSARFSLPSLIVTRIMAMIVRDSFGGREVISNKERTVCVLGIQVWECQTVAMWLLSPRHSLKYGTQSAGRMLSRRLKKTDTYQQARGELQAAVPIDDRWMKKEKSSNCVDSVGENH
jgi:hypothetical protein